MRGILAGVFAICNRHVSQGALPPASKPATLEHARCPCTNCIYSPETASLRHEPRPADQQPVGWAGLPRLRLSLPAVLQPAHMRLPCPCACRPLCQAAAPPAARSSARRTPLAARASSREAELAKMQEFKAGLSQTLDSAAKRPTATGEGRLGGCVTSRLQGPQTLISARIGGAARHLAHAAAMPPPTAHRARACPPRSLRFHL